MNINERGSTGRVKIICQLMLDFVALRMRMFCTKTPSPVHNYSCEKITVKNRDALFTCYSYKVDSLNL